MGIGFAIPINMAKAAYDQLIEGGTVVRGFLGVGYQELTPELADFYGISDAKGVVLTEVVEDSAAEKAGLKYDDIIIEFNGQPVEKADAFRNRVAILKPGTTVKIVVLRDGKRRTFNVKLGERPPMGELAGARPEALEELGFYVLDLSDDLARHYGYEGLSGVIVTQVEPGSLAEFGGIKTGTLIMEVNRTEVENTKEFNEAIEEAGKRGRILLRIKDRYSTRLVVLTLPRK